MRTSSLYMPKPAAPHVYLWLIYTNISVILLVTRGGEGSTSAGRAPAGFASSPSLERPPAALRSYALYPRPYMSASRVGVRWAAVRM